MSKKIIVYGSPTCTMVPPVRGMLQRANVPFDYVDISKDASGRAVVQEINNGYESVPTLVFPDEDTLTEPPLATLKAKLESLGYETKPPTLTDILRENLMMTLIGVGMVLFGIIDGGNWVFIGIGTAVFLYLLFTNLVTSKL